MKLTKDTVIVVLVLLLCAGCATGYHRQGWTGGYNESQLQEDIFRVSFKGNAFIDKEKVQDYLLLRCAEITIDHGFDYFIILGEENSIEVSSYTTPTNVSAQTTSQGNVGYSGSAYGNTIYGTDAYSQQTTGNATITGGDTYYFSKPRSNCVIKCFKGKKPVDLPNAFTAYQLIGYLKDKVR